MLDLHKRQAYHLEVVLDRIPKDAPPIYFEMFIDEFIRHIDDGNAVYLSENKTKAMRARQCRLDRKNEVLHLLIGYSDTTVTDPVFETLETGELRTEPKLAGEGIAISTQIAIDLVPSKDGVPVYKAYLEDVPGVGRTKLTPFFTAVARDAGVDVPWRDPEGKVRNSRPDFKLRGSMSQSLKDDLEKGRLSMIELSTLPEPSEFDEDGEVVEEIRTVKLKVDRTLRERTIEFIDKVRRKAHDRGYDEMKVTYSPDKKRQTSKRFGTAREDVADVLTIKVSEVSVDEHRQQCEPELRLDVAQKLTAILLAERNK